MAEIKIITEGDVPSTEIFINGHRLDGIREFHFSMNPTREKYGTMIKGKCKMNQGFDGEFRSYFAEDFKKIDEFMKPTKQEN